LQTLPVYKDCRVRSPSFAGYCYNLKNQLEDEKGLGGKIGEEDKETITKAVQDALDWLEENQSAEAEEFKDKLKEVEKIVNPIVGSVYQGAGGAPGAGAGGAGGDDEDFGNEEL